MIDILKIEYAALDLPEILTLLFHPRPELGKSGAETPEKNMLIPVEKEVFIGARFHAVEKTAPILLFFHGNGEIVADYDELGPIYNRIGINFLPVDYRGYGRSTGTPTVTSMMRDCHIIFDFVKKWVEENEYSGPLVIMGRSLGSASVLELAYHYKNEIDGLIIESGFADFGPLLTLLGVNTGLIGFEEGADFQNRIKIRSFDKPTLIIHAEKDHIIPFSDGQTLYDACEAQDKTFLAIPGANHNDIFMRGLSEYMAAIKTLVEKV